MLGVNGVLRAMLDIYTAAMGFGLQLFELTLIFHFCCLRTYPQLITVMMPTNPIITMDLNESRASKVATVILLLPALAATCVALRLYTRFVLGMK
jgi:hypothetical protein